MASMTAPRAQRCAIWFGAPQPREQALFGAIGWHLRSVCADALHRVR